jgi:hypothetical protein
MTKLKLFISLLLITTISYAQFTVAKSDGTPINDGDVFTYSTNTYPDSNLEFVVTNTTNQGIDVVIEVVSVDGTNGSGMEVCFGLCYSGIALSGVYPSPPYHLDANASSEAHGNHFFNTASSNNGDVIEYVFKFKQVDTNGDQIGNSVTITYRYDVNAAVNDYNNIDFSVYPSIVTSNALTIKTTDNLQVTFVDLQGKTVKQFKVDNSTNQVDISDLKSGTYFLLISNKIGKEEFVKIIKQ